MGRNGQQGIHPLSGHRLLAVLSGLGSLLWCTPADRLGTSVACRALGAALRALQGDVRRALHAVGLLEQALQITPSRPADEQEAGDQMDVDRPHPAPAPLGAVGGGEDVEMDEDEEAPTARVDLATAAASRPIRPPLAPAPAAAAAASGAANGSATRQPALVPLSRPQSTGRLPAAAAAAAPAPGATAGDAEELSWLDDFEMSLKRTGQQQAPPVTMAEAPEPSHLERLLAAPQQQPAALDPLIALLEMPQPQPAPPLGFGLFASQAAFPAAAAATDGSSGVSRPNFGLLEVSASVSFPFGLLLYRRA